MINMNALFKLHPNVACVIDGIAYDVDGNEVAYDKDAVEALSDSLAYIDRRAAEYPPMSDYLDGVVKGDQAQIDKYIADCLAVKAKYPKPE